ncbi:MAG: hypothetical protein Q9160_002904 [Pyrenula sp. 1 TL-2023]
MTGELPASSSLYPLAERKALKKYYLGRTLNDVGTPAAVIDVAKAACNCRSMLDAVDRLGVNFRAHVKTHKTTELTRLQVGDTSKQVKLVVSTVIEAESLLPYLNECQNGGRTVNVLYGVPLPPSSVTRLANIGRELGNGSLAVMIDHPDQLAALPNFKSLAGFPAGVFCKVDTGYHRAGVEPQGESISNLVKSIIREEAVGNLVFEGFYSHAGDSYGGNSANDAMERLSEEIQRCVIAADHCPNGARKPTISVGATPTTVSIENLQTLNHDRLVESIESAKARFNLELHAGVYPLLDEQQIATHVRSGKTNDSIALTILAEVCSLYSERDRPQALIAAGCLSLGREPCKDYSGHGVVAPWNMDYTLPKDPMKEGLIVAKVSQEHGILSFAGENSRIDLPLKIGQKVKIWPNHACVAGAGYGWYFVVDSEKDSTASIIVDIWVRWRGW